MDSADNADFDYALTLLEERRFTEAVAAFTEIVALSPELVGAYGNRGLAYLNLGLEDEAARDFEKVLQLDPDDAMGYSMLAEVTRFRGPPEETLALVVDALDIDPEEPQAHFIRGWLFAKAGQYEEAAEDIGVFLATYDENCDVRWLCDACRTLAGTDPADEEGMPLDTPEAADNYLSGRGWSFDTEGRPDFEERGLPCAYAHCIHNCPPLSSETPDGCPVFGYACPGGRWQVSWCRENPRQLD